jgi:hypothetical protein
MNLLLFLALAVPLSCLAFLSSVALLGIMTLGGVIIWLAQSGRAGRNNLLGRGLEGRHFRCHANSPSQSSGSDHVRGLGRRRHHDRVLGPLR